MTESHLEKHWEDIYFSENCHEKEIIDALPSLIPQNVDVFIDLGASGGQYTFFAHQILHNKTIVAVEADPTRYRILEKNCLKWSANGQNTIIAYHKAIHEKNDATIDFFTTNTDISGALFINKHIRDHIDLRELKISKLQIKTISLISLLENHQGKNVFIKMDVEGAEYGVFRGAFRRLKHHDISFLMEINGWKDPTTGLYPWTIFWYFQKAGFYPRYYTKHFLVKRSSNLFTSGAFNLFFATIFVLKYFWDKVTNRQSFT